MTDATGPLSAGAAFLLSTGYACIVFVIGAACYHWLKGD